MNGIVRFAAAVNRVNCCNPEDCLEEITQLLRQMSGQGCDIAVFPKLALCSPSCGSLLSNSSLLEACATALDTLQAMTRDTDGYLLVGLPVEEYGNVISAMVVLHRGELVTTIPLSGSDAVQTADRSDGFAAPGTLFGCGSLRFCVLDCDPAELPIRAEAAVQSGCDLMIVPAYAPVYAGYVEEVCAAARAVSRSAGCAVAVVNGGAGDTSHPWAYQGFAAVYECGEALVKQCTDGESMLCLADLDADVIHACKRRKRAAKPIRTVAAAAEKPGLHRPLTQNPWLPAEHSDRYLDSLFDLQVRSLAARMKNIGVSRLVLGVSGGLDSTAALLCCAGACDLLGLPRSSIIGITMPGFGTSDHTYYNALALLDKLGVTSRDISIRAAVQQHLEDISHTGKKDVVFENAQARERTQVLLDIANGVGGIVVGTGDLSEEALGFCTFAGDQIAGYNVNVCIPKTLLQALVRRVTESGRIANVTELVAAVLDTPISPELLPPDEGGAIQQKTEEILGPYLLHDFFLYYFARYRLAPSRIYDYACAAFADAFEPAYIREKLRLFFKRFCAAQFKRSCAPDTASITEVNLNGVRFAMPSDMDASVFLRDLDKAI